MKLRWQSFFCIQVLFTVFLHALTVRANPNLLSELSPCALTCLVKTVPEADCELTDIACQCASKNLTRLATECMLEECTIAESLKLVQIDAIQCDLPHNNRHAVIEVFAILTPTVTFFMLSLRLLSRLWTIGRLWWDDWFHIVAAAFVIPLTVFACLCASHGFGYHLYDIDFTSVSQASDLLFWFYLCQIFWGLGIFFVKLSILCLYLRVFPDARFRLAVYISMTALAISVLTLLAMTVWQCDPIDTPWTLDYARAHCLNISNIAYANAAVNIATEVVILILPLPVLHTLRVTGRKKAALYALFGAGLLVIAIASARIPTLSHIATFNDPTYNNVPVYVWTCAEMTAVHVCAAAPAVRSLVSRVKNEVTTRTATNRTGQDFSLDPYVKKTTMITTTTTTATTYSSNKAATVSTTGRNTYDGARPPSPYSPFQKRRSSVEMDAEQQQEYHEMELQEFQTSAQRFPHSLFGLGTCSLDAISERAEGRHSIEDASSEEDCEHGQSFLDV